jgi:2-iminobutanoate/2-iminopropanoate deaminase
MAGKKERQRFLHVQGVDQDYLFQERGRVMKQDRRNVLKKSAALIAAASVVGTLKAEAKEKSKKKVYYTGGKPPEKTPLFSGAVSFGSLQFNAGKGQNFPGDISSHTKNVLDEIEK